MMPAIAGDQHLIIFGVLVGLSWLGMMIDQTRLGRVTTGIVWTIGGALILSNTNIIPKEAAAYSLVSSFLVPLSIPLFLFQVNLRDIFARSGRVMTAFSIGAVGTTLGAAIGAFFLDLGTLEHKLAGIYTATYIGGSMNFVASAQALGVEEGAFLSAAIAADNIAGNLYLVLLALAPASAALVRLFAPEPDGAATSAAIENDKEPATTMHTMTAALAVSFGSCILGYQLASWFGTPSYGILYISALALIPGTLFPNLVRGMAGSFDIGILFAFIFFATIGARADVSTLASVAPSLLAFATIIIVTHALVLFPTARALKLTLAETITASNACILGPTTAAALAAARGWRRLITPGLLVGVFGYAIGTFIGVTLAELSGRF